MLDWCCLGAAGSLRAAFPLGAAAKPVTDGGEGGCVAVKRGGEGQRQSPDCPAVVKLNGEEKRDGHQGSGGAAEEPGGIFAGEKKNPGQPVGDEEAEQRGDKQQ